MDMWRPLWLLCASALLACHRTPEPAPRITLGAVTREERCLTCHATTAGLDEAHDPSRVGCSPCHLGDARATREETAHVGMLRIPGGLDRVFETCGQAGCHASESARVITSPMAGAPGILAIDKFAFGERDTPVVREEDDLRRLARTSQSPAEDHVRKLCGSCHLAAPKHEPGDQGFFARGGGCTACHLGAPLARGKAARGTHPSVTADVSEHRCEGCHARSGRISLSYRGIAEVEPAHATEKLPDGRPVTRTSMDVHARAGMTCIDCHAERDVMGDGSFHGYARDAVEARCEDCHARELRSTGVSDDAAAVARVLTTSWKRRRLPPLDGRTPIVMRRGTPLYRTDVASRTLLLATTGQSRVLPELAPSAHHTLRGHERLSCQSCHTQWAPRCTQCHTTFTASEKGFDHLREEDTPGAWHEEAGGNGFGLPALALEPSGRIGPFVEGMSLRLTGVPQASQARELWAPLDAHTTGGARPCTSCHPGDARTYPATGEITRVGARLLDASERERIAQVGVCLPCHATYEDVVYGDFARSLEQLRNRTREPHTARVHACKGLR